MAQRTALSTKCKHCNIGSRLIVFPTTNRPLERLSSCFNGSVNIQPSSFSVCENFIEPPILGSLEYPNTAEILLAEVQLLSATTGLKFDATCQEVIRSATKGCVFCLTALGRYVLACADPMIASGQDFVVEPAWLQGEVFGLIHSNGGLHSEAHEIFAYQEASKTPQQRKSYSELKKPSGIKKWKQRTPASTKTQQLPGKEKKCDSCGRHVPEKLFKKHAKLCRDDLFSCQFCDKSGLSKRGMKIHLWSCRGDNCPQKDVLCNREALEKLVEDIISAQKKIDKVLDKDSN